MKAAWASLEYEEWPISRLALNHTKGEDHACSLADLERKPIPYI